MSTDNPSAFPFPYPGAHGERVEKGMSLHTWQWTQFAAAAISGLCVGQAGMLRPSDRSTWSAYASGPPDEGIADRAICIADRMMAVIAERAKPDKPTPIPSTLYPRTEMD